MTPAFFVAKIISPFDKNRLTRTNVRIIIQTPTESGKLNIAIRAQIARLGTRRWLFFIADGLYI